MTKQRSFAVTLLPLFSTSAALHTALMLFAFREAPIADHMGMAIWWVFLTVYHFVMVNFLKTPRDLRSIVIVSALFLIGQLAAVYLLSPVFPTITWWLATMAAWISIYYRCAASLLEGVKPEAMMVNFEVSVLTLLFSAVVINGNVMDPGVLIHLCIGLFCILVAMMRLRTLHTRIDTRNNETAAGFLLPLILVVIAAFVILFCVIISGSAAQILTRITTWLSQLLISAANMIGAFFFWLFSLFPQPPSGPGEEAFEAPSLPSAQQEQVATNNGIILYVLILAVVAGLVICVIKLWHTVHLRSPSMKRTVHSVVVKKNSLRDVFKRFFQKLMGRLRFHLRYLHERNTIPGLLVWIERRMRRIRMGRKIGETPSAFLARVAERYPRCQNELRYLAGQLDQYYFGGGDGLSSETVVKLRKKLKAAFSATKHTHERKPHL